MDEALKNSTGQVEILVSLPDPDRQFSLNTFLNATFSMGNKMELTIPTSALIQTSDKTFVYVVNDKYFRRTLVETGVQNKEMIVVHRGLEEEELVVTSPVETLWLTELKVHQGAEK